MYFKDEKVLIIGHTGFKGSWLTNWLDLYGAKIYGISKFSINMSFNYKCINSKKILIKEFDFDIRDYKKLKKTINNIKPKYIFFLAAQSLVGDSYLKPKETWSINLIGALNFLEVVKQIKFRSNIIIITSDKCYLNVEKKTGYKETDMLGGTDPYSASKASIEILYKSYFESFLKFKKNICSSTARAGNVIGGGDLSKNRIVADAIKSWKNKIKLKLRNPKSTRPWQHVLEPLSGYLKLSQYLNNGKLNGTSFNFGPSVKNSKTVIKLIKEMSKHLDNFEFNISNKNIFQEHKLLQLNCTEAKKKLKWKPRLNFKETVSFTTDWYIEKFKNKKKDMRKFNIKQIEKFMKYD
jgi:CDP-glucose 4,6-dehydratase